MGELPGDGYAEIVGNDIDARAIFRAVFQDLAEAIRLTLVPERVRADDVPVCRGEDVLERVVAAKSAGSSE